MPPSLRDFTIVNVCSFQGVFFSTETELGIQVNLNVLVQDVQVSRSYIVNKNTVEYLFIYFVHLSKAVQSDGSL